MSLRRLEAEQSNSPEPRLSDGGHPAVLRRPVRTQHILMSCYGRGRCHFILFLFAKLHLIISDANPTCRIPEPRLVVRPRRLPRAWPALDVVPGLGWAEWDVRSIIVEMNSDSHRRSCSSCCMIVKLLTHWEQQMHCERMYVNARLPLAGGLIKQTTMAADWSVCLQPICQSQSVY